MAAEDYYRVLGVSKSATQEEIRKSYKKLARKYHPDVSPGDDEAEKKFKEIQEAYDVLGDEEKRKQYDQFGPAFQGAGRGPRGGTYQWSPGGGAGPVDFADLFGGGGVDLGDLFGGAFRQGGGGFEGGRRRAATPRKGQDIHAEIDIPFQIAAEGGTHELQMQRDGKTERLSVKIPSGVNTGSVIRLGGQGNPGFNGGPAGDLLVTVRIAPHPWFRREGQNLLIDVPITPAEAALGAKVEVPTLSEGRVVVTIPPGTSSGAKLRLKEKGVCNQRTNARGDQYVVVKIVVPKSLDEPARKLYEQLAELPEQSPRDSLW